MIWTDTETVEYLTENHLAGTVSQLIKTMRKLAGSVSNWTVKLEDLSGVCQY